MFTDKNGTQWRNLIEQVDKNKIDINNIINGTQTLAEFGIKIMNVSLDGEIPVDPPVPVEGDTSTYGYAWLVSIDIDIYDLWIWTRIIDENEPSGFSSAWINFGQFPAPGPQGERGDEGEKGATGATGATGARGTTTYFQPTPPVSGMITGDFTLTPDFNMYRFTGTQWSLIGNIIGDKGDKGDKGIDGKTPYISGGYWWINNVNTNVRAEGTTGQTLNIQSGTFTVSTVPNFNTTSVGDAFIVTDDPIYGQALYFHGYGGVAFTAIDWQPAQGETGPQGPQGIPGTDEFARQTNLFVSPTGIDALGRGTQTLPYKTVSFAIYQSLTNTIAAPVYINVSGTCNMGASVVDVTLFAPIIINSFGAGPNLLVCDNPLILNGNVNLDINIDIKVNVYNPFRFAQGIVNLNIRKNIEWSNNTRHGFLCAGNVQSSLVFVNLYSTITFTNPPTYNIAIFGPMTTAGIINSFTAMTQYEDHVFTNAYYDEFSDIQFEGRGTVDAMILQSKLIAEKSYVGQIIEFDYTGTSVPVADRFDTVPKVEAYFGGTWQAYAQGRVLVGVGTSDQSFAIGTIGGNSTHTLSTAEMPIHHHVTASAPSATTTSFENAGLIRNIESTAFYDIDNTFSDAGGSQAHNNLQPYQTAYIWRRIA
jgi:hypothetical protein